MTDTQLGSLEQLALLAVWQLGDEDAYGARIRREIAARTGRRLSISALYVTLMRLEDKGLVRSFLAEPEPVQGGKAKRLFRIEPAGIEALRAARAQLDRMWEGLDRGADKALVR